ncbi:MAG: hypothetical protein WC260_01700 [Candidatus Pacearchaeota archaeon]
MNVNNNVILDLEIKNILNSYFENVFDSGSVYNFKCNVCGDSKTDKRKKRGFILRNKEPMVYYCHNCLYSTTVEKWMRQYFPLNYRNYRSELRRNKNPKKVDESVFKNIKRCKHDNINLSEKEKKYTKYFEPIGKHPKVLDICINRKIPKKVYDKWYFCTNGKFKNRIIIPFYNDKGKIYYYQGRSIYKWMSPKYKSRLGDYNNIYNYYLVDKDKPVIVVEGPLDSIFLSPCIAVTGLKIKDKKLEVFKQKYYLLDNDTPGKETSLKLILDGQYVFNWNKFLKMFPCEQDIKDVNDFIIHNKYGINHLTFDELKPYFTKNLFDKIYFI